MRSATPLDAFNAVAGFTGSMLDYRANKNRELNTFDLTNNNASIQTNIQNWIRDNQYIGADSEEGDEQSYQGYLSRMNAFIDEQYTAAFRKNNSPYYQRMLRQMGEQSLEGARNYALGEADKWRIQREHVHMGEDIQKYLEAHKQKDWDPQQTLAAIYNRIDLSGTKIDLNPQQRSQMRRSAEAAVYQQHAINIFEELDDVNKIEDAWKRVREEFAFMPEETLNTFDEKGNIINEYDEDGNIIINKRAWSFEGKDEWEKALEEREKARIQKEHFQIFQEKQAEMERLVISGNIDGANRLAREWGAKWNRYYNPNNSEYANINSDYLDRGSGYFRTLDGYARQGGGGGQGTMAARIELNPDRWIRAVLPGGGGVVYGTNIRELGNLKESWDSFIYHAEQNFRLTNGTGPVADANWADRRNEWYQKFHAEVYKILGEDEHRHLKTAFDRLMNWDTYRNAGRNTGLQIANTEEGDRLIQQCVSFTMDLFWSGVTDPGQLERRVQGFIAGNISRNLNWRVENNEEQRFDRLTAWHADVMAGRANDLMFTPTRTNSYEAFSSEPGESGIVWRNSTFEQHARAVRLAEGVILANIIGIDPRQLTPGWMLSDNKERDPIPKGTFTITSGEHRGTYFLDYDGRNYVVRRGTTLRNSTVVHTRAGPQTAQDRLREYNNLNQGVNPNPRATTRDTSGISGGRR